ncbi:MAG: transcriptional regulator [Acidobacteriota bacterium]|jgi:DNA-binding MarR family transcriptional regulator
MTEPIRELAKLDRVVHEPARLMILTVLEQAGEADFLYLQKECGFTQGNLSSHLGKLEEAEYISIEKTYKGKVPLTVCSITVKGRQAYHDYRRTLRAAFFGGE